MIRKNVNNDISKDSPIGSRDIPMQSPLGWCGKLELMHECSGFKKDMGFKWGCYY